jgi:dUTP pyrophosphatase
MDEIRVKILNRSKFDLPAYETRYSAGMDIRANIDVGIDIEPLERILIPSGLHIQLPVGYEAQIRHRSGLALKHGITVLMSAGTIDADFRGEIKIVLVNLSNQKYTIQAGERICQMIIARHAQVRWEEVNELDETERGNGAFGHTGKK